MEVGHTLYSQELRHIGASCTAGTPCTRRGWDTSALRTQGEGDTGASLSQRRPTPRTRSYTHPELSQEKDIGYWEERFAEAPRSRKTRRVSGGSTDVERPGARVGVERPASRVDSGLSACAAF